MSQLFINNEPWIWIAGLILFLSAYSLLTVWIVNKKKNTSQLVSFYMALKMIKMLIFVSVLLIYQLTVKIETVRFVIVAIVLYLIYLLIDTFFLTHKEKKWKKE